MASNKMLNKHRIKNPKKLKKRKLKVYYYDDVSKYDDHFTVLGRFYNKRAAIRRATRLVRAYKVFPCIVYDENYVAVAEWRE